MIETKGLWDCTCCMFNEVLNIDGKPAVTCKYLKGRALPMASYLWCDDYVDVGYLYTDPATGKQRTQEEMKALLTAEGVKVVLDDEGNVCN